LSELKRRREEIRRANEFGEDVESRLSSSSAFDIKEIWRVMSLFKKAKKARARMHPQGKRKVNEEDIDDPTVLDDTKENKEEQDVKRAMLHAINGIADLHERIKKYV
jgi:hypothetical protein